MGREELTPSTNDYDWLGEGIYFWEGSLQRAEEWAAEKAPENPAVIGAVISLGHCLDLLDRKCLDHVLSTYESLKDATGQQGIALPANAGGPEGKLRRLDCAVINAAVRRPPAGLPAYDSVRGAFQEGPPLADRSGIHKQSHVQIAVHNPNCIKGYFAPRSDNLGHPAV